MVTEVILPVLGETMNEGTIVEWLKQEGDPVQRGDPLYTIESDKATLEVESPAPGFLRKILVPKGQVVPVLAVVGLVTATADEPIPGQVPAATGPAVAEPVAGVAPVPEAAASPAAQTEAGRLFVTPRARKRAREEDVNLTQVAGSGPGGRIEERDVVAYLESAPKASPVARRLAGQSGIDLRTVVGTGPGGRIGKEDVERAAAAAAAPVAQPAPVSPPVAPVPPVPAPTVPTAAPVPAVSVADTPVSGVRAVIARRMYRSHQTTAPVTLTTEVDATAFVELREKLKASLAQQLGFNIGYNDLMIKVAACALREFPNVNATLDSGASGDPTTGVIRQLGQVHVALAVDTERGLLVPVVRDADRKGVAEIAREVRGLVERARTGKALPDELSGSTFTITNLGMHEIDAFTPIINLPEAAILGVGRIKARPAVVDGQICVRQMMWLSLTHDHRLIDGAPAARFLQRIKQLVEEPYLLLA